MLSLSWAAFPIVHPAMSALAYQAVSATPYPHRISGVEWMPTLTQVFAGVVGRRPDASKSVYLHRDRFKVIGVDAGAVAAGVVECQAIRDGADKERVGEPMRSSPNCFRVGSEVAISIGVAEPCPVPAERRGSGEMEKRNEALKGWARWTTSGFGRLISHGKLTPSCAVRPDALASRSLSILSC